MIPVRTSVRLLAFTLALAAASLSARAADGVQITDQDGKVRVEVNGQFFTDYHYKDVPRPFFYPVLGVGDAPMTRNFPMKTVPGEETDHKHHRGLWYGHQLVNGISFWGETGKEGKVVHDKFLELKSGADAGVITAQNKWVAPDGTVVCTDVRTIRIHNRKDERILDFDIAFTAGATELVFGDDKDGAMSIRVAESMRLKFPKDSTEKPTGHIVLSTGVRDQETWGKQAAWCDYYGPVGDKTVGVAIFDHPANPRHPTWWHVRDYGLFAANPFGKRHFEKLKDPKAGEFKVPAGQSVTWRYRYYFHAGDEKQATVAEHYADYVKTTAAK